MELVMHEYQGETAKHNDIQALYTYGWVGLVAEIPRTDQPDGV